MAARGAQGLGGAIVAPATPRDPHHHLHRGRRAQPRAGRVGRDGRRRRRAGVAARRRAHRAAGLALDPLRQRARSALARRRGGRRLADARRGTGERRQLRPRRRDDGDGGPGRPHLRHRPHRRATAGARRGRWRRWASDSPCWARSSSSRAGSRARRSCRCASSPRALTGANVVVFCLGASVFAMWYFVSLYLQQVLGFTPIEAGLAFLPMTAGDHHCLVVRGRGGSRRDRSRARARRRHGAHRGRDGALRPRRRGRESSADVLVPGVLTAVGSGSRSSP